MALDALKVDDCAFGIEIENGPLGADVTQLTGLRPVLKTEICLHYDSLVSSERHEYRLKALFLLRQFAECKLLYS
jgi:hypothetical protein